MIVVADVGPLHYLILIGEDRVLPSLFDRVLVPPAVVDEMSRPEAPEAVRRWIAAPPAWLEIKQPAKIEEIPSLGRKGSTGAGEKAVIALARQERVSIILMDDKIGRKEASRRGLRPIGMLAVLDEAAARGFVDDLPQKLDRLERDTSFYASQQCKRIIEGMKRRDAERKPPG